jgi:hypothetical protein
MALMGNIDQRVKEGRAFRFGISMPRNVVLEIDKVRGDIPRSMWLRRAGLKELERQDKNRKEKEEGLHGAKGLRAQMRQAATTTTTTPTTPMESDDDDASKG